VQQPPSPVVGCLALFGSGHSCLRNAGHNGEHRCGCGVPSAVWLVTKPATQLQIEVKVPRRTRPCWRCRLRALMRRPQQHWNCVAPPDLHYV